jgi:hypothetical protein
MFRIILQILVNLRASENVEAIIARHNISPAKLVITGNVQEEVVNAFSLKKSLRRIVKTGRITIYRD